jgi:hypothetical protein
MREEQMAPAHEATLNTLSLTQGSGEGRDFWRLLKDVVFETSPFEGEIMGESRARVADVFE